MNAEVKSDILNLTVDVVAHFASRCREVNAHEALATRMAFLVSSHRPLLSVHPIENLFDTSHSGRCILKTIAPNSG